MLYTYARRGVFTDKSSESNASEVKRRLTMLLLRYF